MERITKNEKTQYCILAIGFLAYLLSSGRFNIALTVWIWPAAFLYYSRSVDSVRRYLPLVLLMAVGNCLRWINILEAGYVADTAICFLWSSCWILPFIVDRIFYKYLPAWLSTLLLPGTYVTVEFLSHFSPVGSYGVTAYTQTGFLMLMQSVSLIGCFGLSFLILWSGPVLLAAFKREKKWKGLLTLYIVTCSVFLLYGIVRLDRAPVEGLPTVKVASVISPYYRHFNDDNYDAMTFDESLTAFKSEAERAVKQNARILCWNEEAFNIPDNREDDLLAAAKEVAKTHDLVIILPYETEDTDGNDGGLSCNKLMILESDGSVTPYVKTHLVPVVEAPMYVKGNGEVPTVRTENGVLSAIICFDDSYISFNHGFGAKMNKDFPDTDILFVPSWDWPGAARAHKERTEFRAIENGYALVKPTYDGITVVVDRFGRELFLVGIDEIGYDSVSCVNIPLNGKQTFYGRYGNVIDLLFACLGPVLIIMSIIRMSAIRKKKASEKPQV